MKKKQINIIMYVIFRSYSFYLRKEKLNIVISKDKIPPSINKKYNLNS